MKKFLFFIVLVLLILCLCIFIFEKNSKSSSQSSQHESGSINPSENAPQGASSRLLLQTDFEESTVVETPEQQSDALSVVLPDGTPALIPIYYEAGDESGRIAEIVSDPESKGNQVLQCTIDKAQVPGTRRGYFKGRVQLSFSNMKLTEADQSYRMYLDPSLLSYRSFPEENSWFTVNEFWFGASWRGDKYPFRITVSIVKNKGVGSPLRLTVIGATPGPKEGQWKTLWYDYDPNFEVPIGEWMDIKLHYQQGDKDTGRFSLDVKRPSDTKPIRVVDVQNWTYNPQAPKPVPMTSWNPLKVYTSGAIVDFVRSHGGGVRVLFDDLVVRGVGQT